jgi:hypothetical protein
MTCNVRQLGQIHAPKHPAAAMRTDTDEVASGGGEWLVGSPPVNRGSRFVTPYAVDLTRPARALVRRAPGLQEVDQDSPADQEWPALVNRRKPFVEPAAHCVAVGIEQSGHLIHGISAMDLHQAVVVITDAHRSSPTGARVGLRGPIGSLDDLAARLDLELKPSLYFRFQPADCTPTEANRTGKSFL